MASKQHVGTGRQSMCVAAFTSGLNVPGARFRVRQYVPALRQIGIVVREYWPRLGSYPPRSRWWRPAWALGSLAERVPQIARGWGADVTLLRREMLSTLPTLEGLTRRPRLVDVDDAIHLQRGGLAARHLARVADKVVVGNNWLAEVWRQWHPDVEVIPTAVAVEDFRPSPLPERPLIGWIGTSGNLRCLEALAEPLAEVVRRFPEVVIAVCCDRPPLLPGLPVRFVPWQEGVERAFLDSLFMGLMPLEDTAWSRGKCAFKMLQYMAAARPCVVSPIGVNAEILAKADVGLPAVTPAEWREALCALISDRRAAASMGRNGRRLVEAEYSVARIAPRLAEALRALV